MERKPVEFLLDLSIQDGIKLILATISKWADTYFTSDKTEVSSELREYVKSLRKNYYHKEIDGWPARRYWEDLISAFHRRMRDRKIEQTRFRASYTLSAISESELEKRATLLVNRISDLSIDSALDFFENLIVEWVITCDQNSLISFVKYQVPVDDTWKEKDYCEFVLYHLSELTEH